jgi:predicted NodU family carbamoyl transferase
MLAQFLLELVNFRAFAADDHARTRGQNRDAAAVGRAFDQNSRHRGRFELLLQQLADFAVFGEQRAEFLLAGIPLGAPVFVDGDAQTDWICFLAHIIRRTRVILMWQRRLRIGPAEPRALGVKRLSVVAVPATASLMRNFPA